MRMPTDAVDGPIRTVVREQSLSDIDWTSTQLTPRDLLLLERLDHERRVRVELGMPEAAIGLAEAMLIIWHTATTPDVCVGHGLPG
ncbi:MAG: hypothetical protein U1E89_18560 [Burkholderiaceae bacterium]